MVFKLTSQRLRPSCIAAEPPRNVQPLLIGGEDVETVESFIYLGSVITKGNDCPAEVRRRMALACGALAGFEKIWRSSKIHLNTKVTFSVLASSACSSTFAKQGPSARQTARNYWRLSNGVKRGEYLTSGGSSG